MLGAEDPDNIFRQKSLAYNLIQKGWMHLSKDEMSAVRRFFELPEQSSASFKASVTQALEKAVAVDYVK